MRPLNSSKWKTSLAGQSWALQLYCQQPGHWHPVGEPYTLNQPAKWLQTIAPHVRRLVKILQFSAPLLVPGAAFVAPDVAAILKKDLDLMNALVKALPEIESKSGPDVANLASSSEGAALRELRALLEDLDPRRLWGGLKKVHTPEGDYLWLCGHHCKKYE